MKYFRLMAAAIVVVVFIIPMHVLVTVSADEEQYRKFKRGTQDKTLERLWMWVDGRKPRIVRFNNASLFDA